MADHIKVSASHMKKDIEDLIILKEEIPDAIDRLNEAMSQLASCWDGPAWGQFQRQVASDIQNMHELYEYLSSYMETLDDSREKYIQAELKVWNNARFIMI